MKRLLLSVAFGCLSLSINAQEIEARLFRPSANTLVMKYDPAHVDESMALKPTLHLYGRGFEPGAGSLDFVIRAKGRELVRRRVEVTGKVFEQCIQLEEAFPQADHVTWSYQARSETRTGAASLCWSRLHGRLDYVDGRMRPSYISLHPYSFRGGEFVVPVGEDGRFDVLLPAGVYAIINVNGAGFGVDAMERWAWNFDLSRDREEVFRLGRTELYSMHAFGIQGSSSTTFVCFRPSSLTRILQHSVSHDVRPQDPASMALLAEHLKADPMAIAPKLKKEQVKVWLDGVPERVTDLTAVVETSAQGTPQTQYLLQITPTKRMERGIHHEVKVEVESVDVLDGKLVTDFGQGSVGIYLE